MRPVDTVANKYLHTVLIRSVGCSDSPSNPLLCLFIQYQWCSTGIFALLRSASTDPVPHSHNLTRTSLLSLYSHSHTLTRLTLLPLVYSHSAHPTPTRILSLSSPYSHSHTLTQLTLLPLAYSHSAHSTGIFLRLREVKISDFAATLSTLGELASKTCRTLRSTCSECRKQPSSFTQ